MMCDDQKLVSSSSNDSNILKQSNDQLKRKYLGIFPSLFRRKSPRYKEASYYGLFKKHNSFEVLNDGLHSHNTDFPITEANLIPGSPISPRVKNFNSDMRCLAMSRVDNPYITPPIERSNSISSDYTTGCSDYSLSTPILSSRKNRERHYVPTTSVNPTRPDFDLKLLKNNFNLHDKLIRSPPPNFPKQLTQFTFVDETISREIDEDISNH